MERDRIVTIPNAISFLRLLGVPLFLYLFLVSDELGWAVVVLAVGGTTDWVDGFLARRLGQVSRLGELMDPLADRLYTLATLLAFTIGGVVPWIFTAALLARDVVMIGCVAVVKRKGFGTLPVHYLGKAATAQLLLAFPVLLLSAAAEGSVAAWAHAIGWGLAWWGLVFYWISAIFYLAQAAGLIRASRRVAAA
ncbi:cardiolipin synthase [Allocatelliglobosispora scoriae]|uniref:Cardiolipin synthase n=1 Tax=Allocatelliglobosispora scoriae TaxID=643052 RepID=A0A841C2D1_9ACTN|nr:CDP-alcohol phosphatidyltransferase family protein [Allocatelliglobosispora scoriae]MBB5874046.1 cardiolipin synthase [Allocatelliglobosispora scoriae]